MDTTPTAAQPLDLDQLETAALAVENAATSDGEAAAYEELHALLSARVALALIAQARAAKPESATGTTGATVIWPSEKFVHERIATLMADIGMADDTPLWNAFSRFEADLRSRVEAAPASAQPAVKDHVLCGVVNSLRDTALVYHAHGSLRERLRQCLDPLLPASVQPDRGADVAPSDAKGNADAAKAGDPVWHDGAPPFPWNQEWFIAQTIYGDKVVLRALHEDHAYDYKTADETYMAARNIKCWMQFPDGEYVQFKDGQSPATSAADAKDAAPSSAAGKEGGDRG